MIVVLCIDVPVVIVMWYFAVPLVSVVRCLLIDSMERSYRDGFYSSWFFCNDCRMIYHLIVVPLY